MSTILRDLPAGDQAYEIAAPEFEFPFLANGDNRSFILTRRYKQTVAGWTADRFAGKFMPGMAKDDTYPQAYLVAESKPQRTATTLCEFTRTFAVIPEQQVDYGSLSLNKPSPGRVIAANMNMQTVTGGGTSTNLGAQFDYLTHYWDMSGGKIYGPYVAVSGADAGSDYDVTWSTHGLAGTETLAMYANYNSGSSTGVLIFGPSYYSRPDGNTVRLTGWAASMSSVDYAGKFLKNYTSGADRIGTKITSDFYLPGVSPGIGTPADITIPSPLINDAAFLAAVVATLTGYVDYDSRDLAKWNDWPIYTLGKTKINMADV